MLRIKISFEKEFIRHNKYKTFLTEFLNITY